MLRRFVKREKVADLIKQVDAFPKVEESYVTTNSFGGLVTLICWLGIVSLLYSELSDYLTPQMKYRYTVDKEADKNLDINIDMTVAMPCGLIGADVLDIWGQDLGGTESLKEELVPFELSTNQKHFLQLQKEQQRGVESAAALHDLMGDYGKHLVPRQDEGNDTPKDACRLFGKIPVSKVKGNFHVLSGRTVNLPGMGHAHLQFGEVHRNFSHRIDGLTFGDRVGGMHYALDGEHRIAPISDYSFQYFIQIVPTMYQTDTVNVQTYQYTVQEQVRAVDPKSGSHGTAGILIKYEFSPIAAVMERKQKNLTIVLTRLLGIIGGIISTSGLINLIITEAYDWICCLKKERPAQAN